MAKMLLLLVVLALGSFIDFVEPRQRPNIQLSLTDKGLNYGKHIFALFEMK